MILQTTATHLFKTPVKRSRRRKESLDRQGNDPTLEEILLACQQIQSEWSPEEKRRRRCAAFLWNDELPLQFKSIGK